MEEAGTSEVVLATVSDSAGPSLRQPGLGGAPMASADEMKQASTATAAKIALLYSGRPLPW